MPVTCSTQKIREKFGASAPLDFASPEPRGVVLLVGVFTFALSPPRAWVITRTALKPEFTRLLGTGRDKCERLTLTSRGGTRDHDTLPRVLGMLVQ